jgi:hypothetical protein
MRLCSSLLAIFLLSAAFAAGPISAQEAEDTAPVAVRPAVESPRPQSGSEPAQVFVEIELTSEGTVAYDSAGGRWAYDFERLQFVPAPATPETGQGRSEGGAEDLLAPVAERCTELKVVDNPALEAVYVNPDEYVEGDIFAYSRVTIKGWVKGSIRSVNKTVLITSTGQVDGDVEAPEVEIRTGGQVLGQVIETPVYGIPVEVITSGFSREGLWVVFGFTLALSLIAFLAVSLTPQRLAYMTDCVVNYSLKSTLVGLLFICLFAPIVSLVVITIVGILVVWLVPIAYFVSFAIGMCAIGYKIHGVAARAFGRGRADARIGSLIGIAVYMGLWALTAVIWGSDDPTLKSGGLDVWLLVISILATCYPLLVGVGAAVLTRFGSRMYESRQGMGRSKHEPAPAPAPPPMPEAPGRFEPRTPPVTPGAGPLGRPDPGPNDLSGN